MIHVVVDDLAFLASDAIVRPVTSRLDATTPAVRRLEKVGGAGFVDPLRLHKELGIGSAVVTGGGDLPAEFVIHAVIRSETEPVSKDGVRRAWASALRRAQEWEFTREYIWRNRPSPRTYRSSWRRRRIARCSRQP